METQSSTPFYLDKGLWTAVLAVLAPLLAKAFGLNINADEMVTVILPAVAYIIGHKWKSGKVLAAEIAAKAQVDAAKATQPATPAGAAAAVSAL